jgi:hypothetical protein
LKKVLLIDETELAGFNSCLIRVMEGAFRGQGMEPVTLDITAPDAAPRITELLAIRREFAFVFSVARGFIKVDGRYLHEHFDIPLFVTFVDHPLYKQHFVDYHLGTVVYGLADPTQVAFCQAFYGGNRFVHVPHFPLVPPLAGLDDAAFARREATLFFPGTSAIQARGWSINVSSPEECGMVRDLEEKGLPIAEFARDFVRNGLSLDAALLEFFEDHGVDVDSRLHENQFATMFREIDVLIRSLRRRRIFQSLAGFPVTVMGRGWDQCNYLPRSVTVLPPVGYLECEQARHRYQMTLHISQGQPQASHDRVLHAAAAGQAVLADRTPGMERAEEHGFLATYSQDAGDLREICSALLADEARRLRMARAGLAYIRDSPITADSAARTVIDALHARGMS